MYAFQKPKKNIDDLYISLFVSSPFFFFPFYSIFCVIFIRSE